MVMDDYDNEILNDAGGEDKHSRSTISFDLEVVWWYY